jgi:hypothetical protein
MLYVVIAQVIHDHNDMIESFYTERRPKHLLPEEPAEISAFEFTSEDRIPYCKLKE